jgi:hypothetical protein
MGTHPSNRLSITSERTSFGHDRSALLQRNPLSLLMMKKLSRSGFPATVLQTFRLPFPPATMPTYRNKPERNWVTLSLFESMRGSRFRLKDLQQEILQAKKRIGAIFGATF